jgi:elongation factor P
MIQATQLRRGNTILHNGELFQVVDYQHITPGNWRGMVQTKLRNLRTGSIVDHRFRSEDRCERAILDDREMEYLYADGSDYHFMERFSATPRSTWWPTPKSTSSFTKGAL